jgi:hypothetical protein
MSHDSEKFLCRGPFLVTITLSNIYTIVHKKKQYQIITDCYIATYHVWQTKRIKRTWGYDQIWLEIKPIDYEYSSACSANAKKVWPAGYIKSPGVSSMLTYANIKHSHHARWTS